MLSMLARVIGSICGCPGAWPKIGGNVFALTGRTGFIAKATPWMCDLSLRVTQASHPVKTERKSLCTLGFDEDDVQDVIGDYKGT
eukprot:1382669-Amorphochlora_amoeboformis.AAC.1